MLNKNLISESLGYKRELFDSTMAAIVVIDADTRVIVDANQISLDILNCNYDDLVGKDCTKMIGAKISGFCTVCEFRQPIYNKEAKIKTLQGEEKTILKSVNIYKYNEKIYFIESFIDITELKNQQNEIQKLIEEANFRNEVIEESLFEKNKLVEDLENTQIELEAALKEKDKLFSIIAHDLKSPFSGLLGLTKMLNENLFNFNITELHEIFSSYYDSLTNIYKLIENLLEWSRLQRGLIPYNPTEIKLMEFINLTLDTLATSLKSKDIKVNIAVNDNDIIFGDVNLVSAIFRNLLTNAIKFSKRNSDINISSKESLNTNFLEICISDSGIGIPKEMIDILFKLGEKTSRPGTEGENSTGLGLVICKEFINLHKGCIWVESEEGKGSKFFFTLPRLI